MVKNKFLALFSYILLLLCLMACGGGNSSSVSTADTENSMTSTIGTTEYPTTEPDLVESSSSFNNQSVVPAEFDEVTLQWKDNDGYTFEGTFAVSDWIKYDDEDLLNATWKSVADNRPFPDFSNHIYIGSTWFNGSYVNASYDCADIVYAIGYYQINNTTSGFDITSEKPVSAFFNFYVSTPLSMMAVAWNDETVLYKSTQKFIHECTDSETGIFTEAKGNSIRLTTGLFLADNGTSPSPRMTANATRVVPFVIVISIAKNPNHPDGIPKMDEVIISPVIYDAESSQVINYDFRPTITQ